MDEYTEEGEKERGRGRQGESGREMKIRREEEKNEEMERWRAW